MTYEYATMLADVAMKLIKQGEGIALSVWNIYLIV